MNKPERGLEELKPLNNRQEYMLRELNEKTGSTHALTSDGYNAAGRSEGILEKLAALGEEDMEAIAKRFGAISRTKPQ